MANETPRDPRYEETSRTEGSTSGKVREGESYWWTHLEGLRRISWGAVFAGAVVALVVQLALGLLGLSIGLSAVDPGSPNALEGMGLAAGMWLLISGIIAFFIGGFVAAHLAGMPISEDGALHGVIAWGLVTVFTFFMMTTAVGQVISGAAGVVGQGVSAVAGTTAEQQAPPREALAEVLTTYTDMTRQEAEQAIREAEQDIQAEVEDVDEEQVAEEATDAAAEAALWAFLAMLIGLVAAAGGGYAGTPRDLPAASRSMRERSR